MSKIKTFFTFSMSSKWTPYKLAGIVLILWILSFVVIKSSVCKWDERGQIGDMFGAVNALFSGLAFAGIIYSIKQQQKELELTRKEYELNRTELELTRQEFNEQNKTLKQQRFDNTFFNLLSIHQENISQLHHDHLSTTYTGRSVLDFIRDGFNSPLSGKNMKFYTPERRNIYYDLYKSHIKPYRVSLSSYLQSFVTLYLTIKGSELISETDKQYYFDIIKSNISLEERRFLYYHLTLSMEDETITILRYMEKELAIVKGLDTMEMLDSSHHSLISFIY